VFFWISSLVSIENYKLIFSDKLRRNFPPWKIKRSG
jgi:hypothetical protein